MSTVSDTPQPNACQRDRCRQPATRCPVPTTDDTRRYRYCSTDCYERDTYACERDACEERFREGDAYGRGAYCSAECLYRDKGRGILAKLDSDRRECSTCFRPVHDHGLNVADLHRSCRDARAKAAAGPVCRDCLKAFEDYRTVIEPPTGRQVTRVERFDKYGRHTYRQGIGCACGVTDPSERHDIVQDAFQPGALANQFWRCLNRLADRGSIDGTPDAEAFRGAWAERPTEWAFIAGRAVYHG